MAPALALDENLDLPRPFGPYTLLRRVAVGGMAEVYVGKTKGIGGFEKLAAIKVIHPRYSEDEHFVKMLVEEAKISVLLTHVNIAQTFDLGEVDGVYYIAMELVEGADGYRVMRKCADAKKALPLDVCAFVVSEMCNGLDYAHRKRDPQTQQPLGIVHRDISPQNVLISFAGEVKIVDFGIAKAASRSEHTEAGVIKGKYYYMSPEQAWGDPMDHRSDIFSTGVVLYELLTGRMLYNDDNIPLLLDKVRKAEIAPPEKRRPSIPKSLSDIVMGALRKDAGDRYQSAQEMGHLLSQWLYTNSPTFSASRLGDLMLALFPQESTRTSGLIELPSSSGNHLIPSSMPAPQIAPKPPVQLSSLADLGAEDGDDVTRHDVLPFRKSKANAVPAAAPLVPSEPDRATFRPAKSVIAREPASAPQPAPAPRVPANDVVTTNPLVAKHEPTDRAANPEQWEDPTNLRDDRNERAAAARPAPRPPAAEDDFEDSTVVDSAGLYRQVQQAMAGKQVVESARGRVNVAAPAKPAAPASGPRNGSVPPPPSRAAWTGKAAPVSRAPAPGAPREQVLETYNHPEPPTNVVQPLRMPPPSEEMTIPISAQDAQVVARSLGMPQQQAGARPSLGIPLPPAQRPSFQQPPPGWQQPGWPTAMPTYAQPTRPISDPFHPPEQPTVPLGSDPFAAPPPPTPIPAELGGPGPTRWPLYVLLVAVLALVAGGIAYLVTPGPPAPSITIVSTPSSADVSMDGRPLGMTPVTITEGLEVGHAYELTVVHAGYQPWRAVIQAQNGLVQQSAILAALPASLHVDTTPPGGMVTVGGSPRGQAPVDVAGFLVGQTVEVRASRPGRGVPVVQSVLLATEATSVTVTTP